jgi:cellulose synthase/poly-beta-1,6-N-acetylglucosamine synthase-like glycosyltransferase
MGEFQPHLSIVVPLYNAAATLPALHREISALQVEGGHELIVVNDGSRDETEAIALKLTRESALPMTLVNLSRNFGEHNAVLAGIRAVRGSWPSPKRKIATWSSAFTSKRNTPGGAMPAAASPIGSRTSLSKNRVAFICAVSAVSAVSWLMSWPNRARRIRTSTVLFFR